MAVLNFLKSFIFPTKMARFRYMSILISICIFILASYLLTIPVKPYLRRSYDKMIEENNYSYLKGLRDITINEETSNVFKELQSLECKAGSDDLLECANLEGTLYETDLTYTNSDNILVNIKFVIDLLDSNGKTQYYPEREFTYSNDAYPNIETEDYFLIIFRKDCIYYRAYPIGIEDANLERNGSKVTSIQFTSFYDYAKNFDFSNFQNDTFYAAPYLISMLKAGHIPVLTTTYSMSFFFYTVVFTLIISFLFWLFFKKNGRLKKFKEYYNTAAIASVIPTLIVFGLLWINPAYSGLYIFGFSVFYLFVLYRINNAREIA